MAIARIGHGEINNYYAQVNSNTGGNVRTQNLQTTQYDTVNMVSCHKVVNESNENIDLQDEQNGKFKELKGTNGTVKVRSMAVSLKSGIIGLSSFGTGDNYHLLEARYADNSNIDNPIIKVRISDEDGSNKEFNININDIDPKNATQLEMFALCSYAEEHGISDSDKNCYSYKTLTDCAFISGYEESDIANFAEKKQNWVKIVDESKKYGKNNELNIRIGTAPIQRLKNLFKVFVENKDMSDEIIEAESDEDEK